MARKLKTIDPGQLVLPEFELQTRVMIIAGEPSFME